MLTHFDQVVGPKIFHSLPTAIPADLEATVLNFMDIRLDHSFFEFNAREFGKLKFLNYIFSLRSQYSRGHNEQIMLTGIFEEPVEGVTFETYFVEIAEKFQEYPDIVKAFNKRAFDPNECSIECENVDNIIKEGYKMLVHKVDQLRFIDRLFSEVKLDPESESALVTSTLTRAFITSIDSRVPEGGRLLYDIGGNIGSKLEVLFKSEDLDFLLEELARFWKKHSFGAIDDVKQVDKQISFNVYDCFECKHMPNVGQTLCKFDEGFLNSLFTIKFEEKFAVKEIECFGTGATHCRFKIEKRITN